jgi:euchromatic histone-lysine N-methyltransferase
MLRRYVLCAKEQGGVARFINHSCDPNLYVQPMCIGHTDLDMVAIGLFAMHTITPFTELT